MARSMPLRSEMKYKPVGTAVPAVAAKPKNPKQSFAIAFAEAKKGK